MHWYWKLELQLNIMIQILILSYFFGNEQFDFYFFDGYIIKEYTYSSSEVMKLNDKAFEIYDIEKDCMYIIPLSQDRKVKVDLSAIRKTLVEKEYQRNKEDLNKVDLNGIRCLKVSKERTGQTPFGEVNSKIHSYYAKMTSFLGRRLNRNTLTFLGVFDYNYDPYLIKIKTEIQYEDGLIIPIYRAEAQMKLVSDSFLESMMNLPEY